MGTEIVIAHETFRFFGCRRKSGQRRNFFAAAVYFHQLFHLFHRQRNPCRLVDVAEPHHPFQHICFLRHSHAGFGIEFHGFGTRKFAQRLDVIIQFEVQAAFQATALSAQLEGVDAQVLVTGSGYVHLFEIGEPGAAAQFAPAGTDAAEAGSFLAVTDMPHFDFHLEGIGVAADQFAEIHPLFGGVEERGFAAIALVFHIADFHSQAQLHADAAGGFECFVFLVLEFVKALKFGFGRRAEDGAHLRIVFLYTVLFKLQTHQFAFQRHDADIKALGCFHHHIIACIQIEEFRVPVELLAASFEAHFHDVEGNIVVWQLHVSEPVVHIEFIAATCSAGAVILATFGRATAAAFGSA